MRSRERELWGEEEMQKMYVKSGRKKYKERKTDPREDKKLKKNRNRRKQEENKVLVGR